ncbi:putative membrane protein [Novosphingobium hassiacum]|uniref:Putative membrane protein n=1 Tax=Novosphingobium hassiacum TaxID=173676 RepID=A0A7W5ZW83_9SPHN|nr:DoxX family protein [Novosphingobium hassiacum]MBB3860218.1 putative membrane protein [Novosphingobium hassiacum]
MIRNVLRFILAGFYFIAGVIHVANPAPFLTIMPGWVPFPDDVVMLTGIAELLGAIGLVQGFSLPLRRAAAIGLALYAICVFPANINHFILDMAKPDHGLGLGYHVPRMFAQPLVVWLALWVGGVTDWPFRARPR